MSIEDRRKHIALSSTRGRKKPKRPPPDVFKDEEDYDKIEYQSDIKDLQNKLFLIYSSSQERNKKIEIIEDELFFILNFFGKISWSVNRNLIRDLPIEIKEIVDDNSIKVSLKKHSYEQFYYAVRRYLSEIKDIKQIEVYDKIKIDLYQNMKNNPDKEDEYIICFLDMFDINKEELYANIKNYINNKDGKIQDIYQSSNMRLFLADIKNIYLSDLITNLDSISLIEKKSEFFLSGHSSDFNLDFLEIKEIEAGALDELIKICIIDSGIYKEHIKIQGLVENTYDLFTENYLPCKDTIPHGTCVAGLSIYGYEPLIVKNPSAKVIMVKNFEKDQGKIIEKVHPLVAIQKTLELFPDVKIFNLSFSSNEMDISSTKALDQILFENKIIAVTSAGNVLSEQIKRRIQNNERYPYYLSNYPIYFPGYCRNIITVGACTNVDTSFVPSGAPSPFSRYGHMNVIVKPDVTEIGGNLDIECSDQDIHIRARGFGINTTSNEDRFIERYGTSFSSPIVANYISRLWTQLQIYNPALLQALLLSSSRMLINQKGNVWDKKLQGFGKPVLEDALYSNKYEVCYLLEGEFSSGYSTHLDEYEFYFPPKANRIEISMVCQKSETVYDTENHDYIKFIVQERPGPGVPYIPFDTILGNRKCYHTYKGFRDIKKGSKGEWRIQISPNFFTSDLYYLKMRYGCVIKVINKRRNADIRKIIDENWLNRKLEEQKLSGEPITEEVNPLIPIRVNNPIST